MNGFDLINRYKIEEYITAMSHAIPYNYNKSKCIDIKVKDVNAQWGVEFVHENEKWEFSGLVKYTIFWT
jgi:hypothetical protein